MNISDKIQLALLITTALVGIASIVISIFTLRSSNKMIEESTRPYLCVYLQAINSGTLHFYVIVKNFGSSGAKITKFIPDFDLEKLKAIDEQKKPFGKIQGTFLAPSQKLYTTIFNVDLNNMPDIMNFKIEYTSCSGKKYSDSFVLNQDVFDGLITGRTSVKQCDESLKIMAHSMQALLENSL